MNIIEKSGTWFSYKEDRLGQGRENVRRYLDQNPELLVTIEKQVRGNLGLFPSAGEVAGEKASETVAEKAEKK